MSKPICIITEPDWVAKDAIQKIEQYFTCILGPFDRNSLAENAKTAHGFFVGLDHKLDQKILNNKTQFVASPTTGLNHIDINFTQKCNIEIISLKGEVEFLNKITATAELCWGLMIALRRRIPHAFQSVNNGEWDRDSFHGHELQNATLGIIGLGRLGRKMACYGKAFDMRVIACDTKDIIHEDVEIVSMDNLLSESDIVTLQANSKPENYHMIGKAEFNKMKKNAVFINTARGDLVDEKALLQALNSKRITGAALDVLEQEFDENHDSSDLINYAKKYDNLIITPHIGGVTHESLYKTTHFTVDKLLKWWEDRND